MFYLKGRGGDSKFSDSASKDEFGWWVGEQDTLKSSNSARSTGTSSKSSSSTSSPMVSCIDSDEDAENCEITEDFKPEDNTPGCTIEFTALTNDVQDLDVELIEKDAVKESDITPVFESREQLAMAVKGKARVQRSHGLSYTPERLVRSQEYRILTPSPRYLSVSQARITPENENPRKARRCRRRLSYLIDSKQIGSTQLKALLDPNAAHILSASKPAYHWRSCQRSRTREEEDPESQNDSAIKETPNSPDSQQPTALLTPDSISKKSSSERLNSTWEDGRQTCTRSSSLEQTSGIHSNDWSSDTHSDSQNPPLYLCDELASANYSLDFSKERVSAINEVVSILGVLETEPDKAAVLLEEDRFCDSTSSHDQLTRLALAIEPDANVPAVLEDPENLVHQLQRKVQRLEVSSKDIFRDICSLRKGLEYDEERIAEISSGATKLRQDILDMRYLDDLLNLLQGELERVSRRRWPFVLGHTERHFEEMNLIV